MIISYSPTVLSSAILSSNSSYSITINSSPLTSFDCVMVVMQQLKE